MDFFLANDPDSLWEWEKKRVQNPVLPFFQPEGMMRTGTSSLESAPPVVKDYPPERAVCKEIVIQGRVIEE